MKDFNLIVTSICEEVKEIAHKLAKDTDLTLTEAEKLLRDTTLDLEGEDDAEIIAICDA